MILNIRTDYEYRPIMRSQHRHTEWTADGSGRDGDMRGVRQIIV